MRAPVRGVTLLEMIVPLGIRRSSPRLISASIASVLDSLVVRGTPRSIWIVLLSAIALGGGLGAATAVLPPFAALGAVVGVLVTGVLLYSVRAGLVCVCAIITLLPFGVIPVKLGASLTFLDATLGIMTLVWLLRLLLPVDPARVRGPSPFMAISTVVCLWIGASFLSFLVGSGFSAPQADTVRMYLKVVLATLYFVVTVQTVRDERTLRIAVLALVLGGAAAAGLGVVLYVLPHGLATQLLSGLRVVGYPSGADVLRFRVDFNHAERAISTSVDPNILGGLLVIVGALALSQTFSRRALLWRPAAAACSALTLFCLLLTYSRGAWIALSVAVVVMATWQYRRLLIVFAVALLVFVQLPASKTFTTELQSGVQVQDKAAGMRLGEINDSLRLIGRYPVFGVGFGAAPDSDLYVGVSNIYLLVGEETGIAGLALFVTAIGLYLVTMVTALPRMRDPVLRGLGVGLFGAAAGMLTAGMFDRYFFSHPHDVALFWLCLALGLCCAAIDADKDCAGSEAPARAGP